jgi:Uma2 family endonuclease
VEKGAPRDSKSHPRGALLVVEVSDTTLNYDRVRKAALYARNGVADYWIVNLLARQLEIRRAPVKNPQGRGFVYSDTTILLPHEFARPLAATRSRVSVADLLP